MTKEESIFQKRILDLAQRAYERNRCTFSDFLDLNAYQILLAVSKEISYVSYELWGGYSEAERRIVGFIPDDYEGDILFPCVCLEIAPLQVKFTEQLTHRDYLGAILNLGIERSKIGDILVEDHVAYLFCDRTIASFIISNLTRVRHTTMKVSSHEFVEGDEFHPHMSEQSGFVASFRLDAVVAFALKISRSESTKLIKEGIVFCNHKQILSCSFEVKPNTILSIRKHGRFMVPEQANKTSKKGRFYITINKYD